MVRERGFPSARGKVMEAVNGIVTGRIVMNSCTRNWEWASKLKLPFVEYSRVSDRVWEVDVS